jgi:hypothetical protein
MIPAESEETVAATVAQRFKPDELFGCLGRDRLRVLALQPNCSCTRVEPRSVRTQRQQPGLPRLPESLSRNTHSDVALMIGDTRP